MIIFIIILLSIISLSLFIHLSVKNEMFKEYKEKNEFRINELLNKIINMEREYNTNIENARKVSSKIASSVTRGKINEHLAPFLPGFEYNPSDCVFVGMPVDLIIFKGLSEDKCEEVIIAEIKSGSSNLSNRERSIKDCINQGRVKYLLLNINENNHITSKEIRTNNKKSS